MSNGNKPKETFKEGLIDYSDYYHSGKGFASHMPKNYESKDVVDWRKPSLSRTYGEAVNKVRAVWGKLTEKK